MGSRRPPAGFGHRREHGVTGDVMAEPHTVRLGQQPDGDRLFHAGDGLVERPTGNGGDVTMSSDGRVSTAA